MVFALPKTSCEADFTYLHVHIQALGFRVLGFRGVKLGHVPVMHCPSTLHGSVRKLDQP